MTVEEFVEKYPKWRDCAELLLRMFGVEDNVEFADNEACQNLLIDIMLSNEYQRLITYMRS